MKKKNRIRAVMMVAIMAFFMPIYANAKEGKVLPKYYKEIVEGIVRNPIFIFDDSWSMENTFAHEKELISHNLSETDTTNSVNTSKLWSQLNKTVADYKEIVLVSDLWDTSEEVLDSASDIKIGVFVPYWSDDTEAVEHIDCVIWEEILPYWTDSEVCIIYLDGVVDVYDNESMRD